MTDPKALVPGTVIADRFRLEAPIGAGGMGVVWRATQVKLERPCAIKVMHEEYASREGARARFEREARVASRLKHPHAVEVYDFGEHDGSLYLAMELLEGHCLREIVDPEQPPLPPADAIRIGSEVADVLVAAHGISLVHRDIKPENIFLQTGITPAPRAKVVDFGLAFIAGAERDGRMTQQGVITGTPDYLSPEQGRGQVIGPPSDIYSLGCVIFEMLTAHAPFEGDSGLVVARHLFMDPPTLRETAPDLAVPGALSDLITRMLHKDPERRPSASSVRDALSAMNPNATLRMGRGREGGRLQGRSARMLSEAPPPPGDSPTAVEVVISETEDARATVAVIGDLDDDLVTALAAREIVTRAAGRPDDTGVDAYLALEQPTNELGAWVETGRPVVADAAPSDVARLRELLRLGVAEVEMRPVDAAKLAKRLWRAINRARRRG